MNVMMSLEIQKEFIDAILRSKYRKYERKEIPKEITFTLINLGGRLARYRLN